MFGGVHCFYGITPELFLDLIPALISSAAVILLVWERLRGSLIKDLKWFHKYVLFKLYNSFRPSLSLYYDPQEGIKRLRSDLEEYGRSMGLHLYPGELPEMLDDFLSKHDEFRAKQEKICGLARKEHKREIRPWPLFYYLKFKPALLSNPNERMRKVAQKLLQEEPELVQESKNLLKNLELSGKQTHELLDDFIKDNKLRLEKPRKGPSVMT